VTKSGKEFVPAAPPLTREEVARWLNDHSDLVLRRIKGKVRAARAEGLGGPFAASLLDEQDILASVTRRVDEAAARGRLSTVETAVLWGYVQGVVGRVIKNRLRTGARDMRVFSLLTEEERGAIAADRDELDRIAPLIERALTPEEWAQVRSRARGVEATGGVPRAGTAATAVRKRWSRLLARVRRVLGCLPHDAFLPQAQRPSRGQHQGGSLSGSAD